MPPWKELRGKITSLRLLWQRILTRIRKFRHETGQTRHNVPSYVFQCPREQQLKKTDSIVSFKKGSGWSNSNLLSCVSGDESKVLITCECVSEAWCHIGAMSILYRYFYWKSVGIERESWGSVVSVYKHTKCHFENSPSSVFDSGVIKIQHGECNLMTESEKDACGQLKLHADHNDSSTKSMDENTGFTVANIVNKNKRSRREPTDS